MRLLLPLLFLFLLAGSCQQRYGHVRKVKMPPTQSAYLPSDPGDTANQVTVDDPVLQTAPSSLEESEEPTTVTSANDLPQASETSLPAPKRIMTENIRGQLEENPVPLFSTATEDDPLREKFLMLAVFFLWIALFFSIVLFLWTWAVSYFLLWFLFTGMVGETVVLLSFAGVFFMALSLILAYLAGMNVIRHQLGHLPSRNDLLKSYFAALAIYALLLLAANTIGWYALILLAVFFLVAVVYSLLWKNNL